MKLKLVKEFTYSGQGILDKVNSKYYLLLACVNCDNVAMLPPNIKITVKYGIVDCDKTIICEGCNKTMTVTNGEIIHG